MNRVTIEDRQTEVNQTEKGNRLKRVNQNIGGKMEEYEIVKTEIAPESITEIMPILEVKTQGVITANFKAKTEILKVYLEKNYPKDMVVSEDNLTKTKKDLAELRKVSQQYKDLIKNAKSKFNEPLQEALDQGASFETALTSTISDLNEKVKNIENGLKAQRKQEHIALYELVLKEAPADVQAFAKDCTSWIYKEQWENKTYSDLQVRNDVKTALDNIALALQVFQGKYRAQALDKFKATGNLASAQAFVKSMEEADKRQAEFEAKQQARTGIASSTPAPTSSPAVEIPKPAQEQNAEAMMSEIKVMQEAPRVVNQDETIVVSAPESYLSDDKTQENCTGFFVVQGKRGLIEWLVDMSVIAGLKMQKATNEIILRKAEIIKAKENH